MWTAKQQKWWYEDRVGARGARSARIRARTCRASVATGCVRSASASPMPMPAPTSRLRSPTNGGACAPLPSPRWARGAMTLRSNG
ncbi:MAG: hypothetical protein ACTHOH_15265 [Lysobacteraceae bacterium]